MKHAKRYDRLNSNKKGLSGPALIGTFILVFLMVFGLIALYQKVMKGGTKVLECKNNGGDCVTGTCDFATQVPALSDKAAGCKSGEICCINITKYTKPADPLCVNHTVGQSCNKSTLMFCDRGNQCVTKCEFCAKNFDYDDISRNVCDINKGYRNPFFTKINGQATTCGCTKAQCDLKKENCSLGYCPGKQTTAQNYACCTTT